MNFLKNLEHLEDRLHVLLLEHTQMTEENLLLKKEIHRLKEQNQRLSLEIQDLVQEKKKGQNLKHEIRKKVESLMQEIEHEIPANTSNIELTPEEIQALIEEPKSVKSVKKVALPKIHFLADSEEGGLENLYEKKIP